MSSWSRGTGDPADRGRLLFCYLLSVVPLLSFGAQILLSRYNVRLRRRPDGTVEARDWTGRTIRLPYPDSVHLYDLGSAQLLVIADSRVDRAIVVNPGWWTEEALGPFLDAIGRPVVGQDATLGEVAGRHPGVRLPFSLTHPVVFAVTLILASMAWLIGSVALGLNLAPGHPL